MILKASGWLTASDFLQFVFYPSPSNQIWSLLWNTKHASNAVTLVFILLFIKWNYSIAFRIPYIYRHLAAHSPGRGSLYSCTLHCTHCTPVHHPVQLCTLVKYSRPGTANFIQYLSSFQDWRICEVEILKIFVKRSSLQFIYVIILKIRCLKDIQDRKEHGQWILARLSR